MKPAACGFSASCASAASICTAMAAAIPGEKCRDSPQSWEACISDAREKDGRLQLFAEIFHLERQDSKDGEISGMLRYRRQEAQKEA